MTKKGFTVRKGGAVKRRAKRAQPADIHSVYDNGGQTIDRYTIVMNWPGRYPEKDVFDALVLSGNPDSPQGFSQFSGARVGLHLGRRITFQDLPKNVQEHAIKRLSHKEAQSQGDAGSLTHYGPDGVIDSIHNAWIILPKALEYARNGETEPTLAVCRGAMDFLTTAIRLLEGG